MIQIQEMRTVALASTSFSCLNFKNPSSFSRVCTHQPSLPESGVCRASEVVDIFETVSPEIVIREARLEDYWEAAETHCTIFFPRYRFPFNLLLRLNRLFSMTFGLSVPSGCSKTCLVAVIGNGHIAGILSVDNVANFLPRKGPERRRRSEIAYISNVAVRERLRRMGIAKRMVQKAEGKARIWGCRAIALHCDSSNHEATKLYAGQGFKCIRVPQGANWPQPKASSEVNFNFMMKLLN